MTRPYYVDKIIGGDGVRRYTLKDNTGKVLFDNITLDMTSPIQQQGSNIGSKDFIRLTSIENLNMFPGIKVQTTLNYEGNGSLLTEVIDIDDNKNELIAKQITRFKQGNSKKDIVSDYTYYQDNHVLYHMETTTQFFPGRIEKYPRFIS